MTFPELVKTTRSRRKFHQDRAVSREILRDLVNNARLVPSAKNLQPLKYILSHTPHRNALIFPHLRWAAYLKDGGIFIPEGSRPSAYIVMLGDKTVTANYSYDPGIAAQTILLGATEKGLGGCVVASLAEAGLRDGLNIPDRFDIILVIALGVPDETVVIENCRNADDIRYWRDADGTHHVPKRALDDIIIDERE